MGRVIAIGDIHGCHAAFLRLLQEIEPTSDDQLVTLGDYVDRGPCSREVIDTLLELKTQCQLVPLVGNHEVMMQVSLEEPSERDFWLSCGGAATLQSYGGTVESIPPAHVKFLQECKMFHETDQYFFVHANYAANVALPKQNEYILLWEHLSTHMPERHQSGKTAIVGHTPQRNGEVLVTDHLICIDTYCYGGGWLTAIDVQSQLIWQVDRDGNLRSPSHA